MLKLQDKGEHPTEINIEPNEGEQTLLSCNKGGICSPSLDFDTDSPLVSEAMLLDQLASIIVQIFIADQDAKYKSKKSSDLLPSVDKGTG